MNQRRWGLPLGGIKSSLEIPELEAAVLWLFCRTGGLFNNSVTAVKVVGTGCVMSFKSFNYCLSKADASCLSLTSLIIVIIINATFEDLLARK